MLAARLPATSTLSGTVASSTLASREIEVGRKDFFLYFATCNTQNRCKQEV